jgi:hypothetical protein
MASSGAPRTLSVKDILLIERIARVCVCVSVSEKRVRYEGMKRRIVERMTIVRGEDECGRGREKCHGEEEK